MKTSIAADSNYQPTKIKFDLITKGTNTFLIRLVLLVKYQSNTGVHKTNTMSVLAGKKVAVEMIKIFKIFHKQGGRRIGAANKNRT